LSFNFSYFGKSSLEAVLKNSRRFDCFDLPHSSRLSEIKHELEDVDYLKLILIIRIFPEVLELLVDADFDWETIYGQIAQSSLYRPALAIITADAANFVTFPKWMQEHLSATDEEVLRKKMTTESKIRAKFSIEEQRRISSVKKQLFIDFKEQLDDISVFKGREILFINSLTLYDLPLNDMIKIKSDKSQRARSIFESHFPTSDYTKIKPSEVSRYERIAIRELVTMKRGEIYKNYLAQDPETIDYLLTIESIKLGFK